MPAPRRAAQPQDHPSRPGTASPLCRRCPLQPLLDRPALLALAWPIPSVAGRQHGPSAPRAQGQRRTGRFVQHPFSGFVSLAGPYALRLTAQTFHVCLTSYPPAAGRHQFAPACKRTHSAGFRTGRCGSRGASRCAAKDGAPGARPLPRTRTAGLPPASPFRSLAALPGSCSAVRPERCCGIVAGGRTPAEIGMPYLRMERT